MNAQPSQCQSFGHGAFASIWTSINQDILRYINKSPENQAAGDSFKTRLGAFLTPQLLCLVVYRVAHYLHVAGWRRMALLCSRLNVVVHKVTIPPQSCIGPGCFLPHPSGVTFCGTAGRGLTLYALAVCCPRNAFLDGSVEHGPKLGDRVTVGGHTVVIGSITVGHDTKVAYTVRLDRDAPPSVLVVSAMMKVKTRPRSTSEAALQTI